MWKYCAFRLAGLLLSHLPQRMSYAIATFIGDLVYLLAHRSRATVVANLSRVITSPSPEPLMTTVRKVFRSAACNYLDLMRIPRFDLPTLERIIRIHGWHHFESALRQRKGIIVATAHLGNFDLVAQVMASRSLGLTVLAEPLQPARLFHHVTGLRESQGLTFLPVNRANLKRVMRLLHAGGVVAVACDRDIQKKGARVTFFGTETTLPTGAVDLALRSGAFLIPAFSVRHSHGFDVFVEPPLVLPTNGVSPATAQKNLTEVIEAYIRRYPEQWVVFEPIWQP